MLQTLLFHANTVGTLAARKLPGCRVIAGLRVAEPRPWRWLVQRRLARRIDRFVCVSQAVASYAQNRGRLPAEQLVVIPNGIDIDKLASAPAADLQDLGKPPAGHVTVCVARLDRQKGLDQLIQVAPKFLARFPQNTLLLVGDGPLRRQLTDQVAAHGLDKSVRFAGFRSDVPEILKACSLFVLPSHYEGMPQALMEAMASGLPVVGKSRRRGQRTARPADRTANIHPRRPTGTGRADDSPCRGQPTGPPHWASKTSSVWPNTFRSST